MLTELSLYVCVCVCVWGGGGGGGGKCMYGKLTANQKPC